MYYKSIKVTIDIPSLAKVIFNIITCYYGIKDSINSN